MNNLSIISNLVTNTIKNRLTLAEFRQWQRGEICLISYIACARDICRGHELLSGAREILNRGHELFSGARKILCRGHELLSGAD
jgi:hypothetical protein